MNDIDNNLKPRYGKNRVEEFGQVCYMLQQIHKNVAFEKKIE